MNAEQRSSNCTDGSGLEVVSDARLGLSQILSRRLRAGINIWIRDTSMHPRTQELLDHLARARVELAAAVASVPPSARQAKPGTDQWSVAEILEHLAIVETRIGAMVERDVAAAKAAGLARETSESPVLDTVDVAGLKDRSHKRVAGEASLPTGTLTADEAWARLEASRAGLERALRDADGWALETLTQPHPRLGAMNLYQWIGFVGAHESRHAAQIADIRLV